jgi:hypothetical protein
VETILASATPARGESWRSITVPSLRVYGVISRA